MAVRLLVFGFFVWAQNTTVRQYQQKKVSDWLGMSCDSTRACLVVWVERMLLVAIVLCSCVCQLGIGPHLPRHVSINRSLTVTTTPHAQGFFCKMSVSFGFWLVSMPLLVAFSASGALEPKARFATIQVGHHHCIWRLAC